MKNYKGYLIDLDGTIYKGKESIDAAKRFIDKLKDKHIPFLFVTNNTTKKAYEVVDFLKKYHNIVVNESNVYTNAMATADYLAQDANVEDKSAYVIGEDGLKDAVSKKGFNLFIDNPKYVVIGLDWDVTYEKLTRATLLIQNGAKFIGTNIDTNIPNERGMLPGAGALVDFVKYSTQKNPVIIGKPETLILNKALEKLQLNKDEVIMVGDNYNTDIKAGINFGIDTLIVYTGVSNSSFVDKQLNKPTYEVNSLDTWEV
ncbi:TIGR01457 family HAD-type hydrolase [Lactobacillus sp. S2-2]|uniref:TIGR01457 family HAD-type hydrolase n=1 Tax=Lactobacillus sp. S2-2 TaxID=2692917 RepID=UPI001F37B16F|nr:TIGR01457 family HAD-type hydrolase [Lactobacillus sp. S2-2]MCF6515838.1 TIGR01457 family HAD-type hydrolase [Lactobacillus sp. S2-2]